MPSESATSAAVAAKTPGAKSSSSAVSAADPSIAAVNSATFSSPMPVRRSPSYSAGGTRPTPQTAARQRSGSTAAQARLRGPPPDQPT